MKKNILALVNILLMASIALSSCSGSIPISTTTPITVTEVPVRVYEYEDLTVGLIQIPAESGWRYANNASFRETAIALGIKLKYYDSALGLEKHQINAFEQFNEDPEINVIVLSPHAETGWEKLLQQAKDAGKIVIIVDYRIDAPEDLYSTFVGSDFVEEGRKAGVEMCKLLEGSQRKNVLELIGNIGSVYAIDRGTGFRETAETCGIVIPGSATANWGLTDGKQVTEFWLKEKIDVQGIFAQNDEMALGAIEAIKEAGFVPAVDVKIISIDATSAAFQAMLDGELNVTVEYNPLLASQVYEAALAALNGEPLPGWIPVEESVFFMDDPNLKEIAADRKY